MVILSTPGCGPVLSQPRSMPGLRWVSRLRLWRSSLKTLSSSGSSRRPYTGATRSLAVGPTSRPIPRSRAFSLSSIPGILLPPVVFGGLVVTLWTYKCVMMVAFQNRIIYMPSVPPFSRSEKVEDYAIHFGPVVWKEHGLRAVDGVSLKLLEGKVRPVSEPKARKYVTVLYFQGNASSLPPRLPHLSAVLRALHASDGHGHGCGETSYTILALSYRGFWTSRGRATQAGIERDAQAALQWVSDRVAQQGPESDVKIVLWGQSIGAGVATTALATLMTQQTPSADSHPPSSPPQQNRLNIHSLILETPFLSIRSMLATLYPQRFLPYRYLWPFLRSTWDSGVAVGKIAIAARRPKGSLRDGVPKKILILQAGKDEIVPAEQSEALERVCRHNLAGVRVEVERVVVGGALHTEVMTKPAGRGVIVRHLSAVFPAER